MDRQTNELHDRQHRRRARLSEIRRMTQVAACATMAVVAALAHSAQKLSVNCDNASQPAIETAQLQGTRVAQTRVDRNRDLTELGLALTSAVPGAIIEVRGTCYEQVRVTTNDIRIVGIDGAVIDGDIGSIVYEGTLTVDGARGVEIDGLTVRNGPDQGIVVSNGAGVVLRDIVTSGNATVGVTVDASYAVIDGATSFDNGTGFDFFTGATVIATAPLTATDNRGAGFEINAGSTVELRGSVLNASTNSGDGITLVNDSNLLILSFPESQGSGVRVMNNGGAAGLFAANSSISSVGSGFQGSGANVFDISGHGVGMLLIASNLASPFGTARFDVQNNGVGVLLTDNSDAFIVGGLNITANEVGILGDGAGVLRLHPNDANPSLVSGNAGPDLLMTFGTRMDLQPGVEHMVLVCDPSVITPIGTQAILCP